MYYYLSFLRPPPKTSPVTSQITITPQVANDLRTEILENTPLPLLYQWILLSPPSLSTPSSTTTFHQPQRPLPLTTFLAPGSSYKPLSIPPPTNLQPNQTYALAVWAKPSAPSARNGWEVDLVDLTQGGRSGCLSVMSEGVRFTAVGGGGGKKGGGGGKGGGGKEGGEKQDRIRRRFVLPGGEGKGEEGKRTVEVVEQTSFDLDKKIWDSGLALSSYLAQHLFPSSSSSSSSSSLADDALNFPLGQASLGRVLDLLRSAGRRELRVLELGTGIGLVSLMLASLLPAPSSPPLASTSSSNPELEPKSNKHTFYATDLPSALPLITENLLSNASLFSPQADIHARELDWEAVGGLPGWVFAGEGEGGKGRRELDLIIMADITYNSSIFPSLIRTLLALLQPQPPQPPHAPTLILLSFKERDPTGAERNLWTLAREAGIWFERVGGVRGHGDGARREEGEGEVEVWVGGLVGEV